MNSKAFYVILACLLGGSPSFAQKSTGWVNYNSDGTRASVINNAASTTYTSESATLYHYPAIAETTTNSELVELARGLQYDPVRIVNYVHDHIKFDLYYGANKGAELTLLERSGNDFDQCALAMSLLRLSGYSNAVYEFGVLDLPYDAVSHQDIHHWLRLNQANTNWATTESFVSQTLFDHGYPSNAIFSYSTGGSADTNTIGLQRVWIKLPLGGTNFYLDPAFKASENVPGIDLHMASGIDTNAFVTAAGGIIGSNYVQNLNEANVRQKLSDYTTNLIAYLQSNYPNASFEQILGGDKITPSASTNLAAQLAFGLDTGSIPVMDWDNEPTNFMSTLSFILDGINEMFYFPSLQGRRLSLNFDPTGAGAMYLDNDVVTNYPVNTGYENAITTVNHPFGNWDFTNNVVIDTGKGDQSDYAYGGTSYQHQSASYVIFYGFDMNYAWVKTRQKVLDQYESVESASGAMFEDLNLIGMNFLQQYELYRNIISYESGIESKFLHGVGRVANESGNGYYVDIYLIENALMAKNVGLTNDRFRINEFSTYVGSALESGCVQQTGSNHLASASTVTMLATNSSQGYPIYIANSNDWAAVYSAESDYGTAAISAITNYVGQGYSVLMAKAGNCYLNVNDVSSFRGYGFAAVQNTPSDSQISMVVGSPSQPYLYGGYSYNEYVITALDAAYTEAEDSALEDFFESLAASDASSAGDPVNMSDGLLNFSGTDLDIGAPEPRGFHLTHMYDPSRHNNNGAGMADGWLHNYIMGAFAICDGTIPLGLGTPQQSAAMLASCRLGLDLYNSKPNAQNWMLTVLIAKWTMDQLITNAVSVQMGKNVVEFIRQPNGQFCPPASVTMTLTQTNGAFRLRQRHGNLFQFSQLGLVTNIVDPYGQAMTFTYNSSNYLSTIKDWKNRQLSFNYGGSPSRLTNVTDGVRNVYFGYSTAYSTNGDLVSLTDTEGKTNTYIYDANHRMVADLNASHQTISSNIYDEFSRIITQYSQGDTNKCWQFFWTDYVNGQSDPVGSSQYYYYDDNGQQIGVRDALGNLTSYTFDGQGNRLSSISPLSETNLAFYDGHLNLTQTIDPLNATNLFVYDSQDNLIYSVDALGRTNSMAYNNYFQLVASTNAAGDWYTNAYDGTTGLLMAKGDVAGVTTYGYDTYGQLISTTYPNGLGTNLLSRNSYGDVMTNITPNGLVQRFQYNSSRQVTNSIVVGISTNTTVYDDNGNVSSTRDGLGNVTSNNWSATKHLLATYLPSTDQGVPVTQYYYDQREWLVSTTDPLFHVTSTYKDAAQRLVAQVDPLLRTNSFQYDLDSRLTASIDPAGYFTSNRLDARGEKVAVVDPAANSVLSKFDATGKLTFLTNKNGNAWQFQYDSVSRLTNIISPLSRTILSHSYNSRGLMQSTTDGKGQTTAFSYDARGRMTNQTDALSVLSFYYDADSHLTNLFENATNLVSQYDVAGRLTNYVDANGYVIKYLYDANSNLLSIVYPGGRAVTNTYDLLNRLRTVTDWAGRVSTFIYDLDSDLKAITRPNGTVRTNNFDASGQITDTSEYGPNPLTAIAYFSLQWTKSSTVMTEFMAPLPHSYAPPSRSATYDAEDRMISFNSAVVSNDLDGNMIFGPLTNNTATSYSFDARNRLVGVVGTGSAPTLSYVYDAANHRISASDGANETIYVIDPQSSSLLMRIKGGLTNYYVYGRGLVYEEEVTAISTNTRTYHFDSRGSTIAITDDNGNVTDRIEYSAYGSLAYRTGTTDTPFLYNGRHGVQTDPNGLLYMRNRYYNPYICRFVNSDPSGFGGGLNTYAYANGNPISLIDPFGLGAETTQYQYPASAPPTDAQVVMNAEAQRFINIAMLGYDPSVFQLRDPSATSIVLFGLPLVLTGGASAAVTTAAEEVGQSTTVIGRMTDLDQFADNPAIDTWAKSGRIPDVGEPPVTWSENQAWLDARIARGDNFGIATDPATLPPVSGGYIPGQPNGYFTAREFQYLQQKGITIQPMH